MSDAALTSNLSLTNVVVVVDTNTTLDHFNIGFGPTFFGYLFEVAIKFGTYESVKLALLPFVVSVSMCRIIAAIISGFVASLVITPVEAVRIRLVSEVGGGGVEGGWISRGSRMLDEEGYWGLTKGLPAMLLKQIPYTVTKNVGFDFFAGLGYSMLPVMGFGAAGLIPTFFKTWISLIAAFLSSMISCVASQPSDMILSTVNAAEGDTTTISAAKDIYAIDGLSGFFTGK